ncbi:MAG: anti-sigma factor family protein [Fimbriimonas sp.]
MRRECAQYREMIVGLAEGRADAATEAHLAVCPECSRHLEQMRSLLSALAYPLLEAPAEFLDRVPMPEAPHRPTLLARLRGLRPALAARSAREDVQLVVGAGDLEMRLVYVYEPDGVRVMGRLPEGDWSTEEGETAVDFLAPSEAETGFVVEGPSARVEVPSLLALTQDGTDGAH